MRNPFDPGFGTLPDIYLDRDDEVKKVTESMCTRHSPYQTTLVYGMRGTGKTAFLTDVCQEVQGQDKRIVVNLAMGSPILPSLVDSIYVQAEGILKKVLEGLRGVTISAFGISIGVEGQAPSHQYQILLEKMLAVLKKKGIWVIVTIDEVKDTPELREFASIYQLLVREEYCLSLIMAGLPQNVSELQNDDVLTFLLRAGRVTLTPIDLWEIKSSYAKVFSSERKISDETLIRITRMTQGYAYAFQLLGYYLWEQPEHEISDQVVENVIPSYKTDLYRNAYVKIFHSLTGVEQQFVNAMAEEDGPEVAFGDIVKRMDKTKNYVSTYRLKLLDTQIIDSPKHGYLKFTLPYFKDFLIENRMLFE